MEEWKTYKLWDICNYSTERVSVDIIDKKDYISTENMLPDRGGINVATTIPSIGNMIKYREGDILISNIRPYFKKIWFANKQGGCSADVLCVRAKENVSNNYLYYLLSQQSFFDYVMAGTKGCKMPRGDKQHIMQWDIKIPVLKDTQERIASILRSLDDKIELNRRINDNLEQQAQALFKSWFVDFEPFQQGKFIESELGLIPEGWRVSTLGSICDVIGGGTPSKAHEEYYCNDGIAWITPKDLSNSHAKYTSHGEIDITETGYTNSSAKLMPRGTVLFSSRAPIGYLSIASNELCTNQGFKSLVPQTAGTCYLYLYLSAYSDVIEAQATGSTFKEASGSLIKSQPVIIPQDKTILDKFELEVRPIFDYQEILEKETQKLVAIRDTLLSKLMSGEIKLTDL